MADLLRVLPISPDTFFYWKRRFDQPDKDCQLKYFIFRIWNQDHHMGVLRITQALLNEFNLKVNHKRVYRLMKELEIQGEGYHKKTRKYNSSKGPEGTRVKNRLHRRFQTDRPNQKMVSDVTEFKVPQTQEKVYFEPIMDLYNNEIITYAITAGSPNLEFALKPLESLVNLIPNQPYKQFLHTDQGWQYRHQSWQKKLKNAHITPSMSRRATCLDNACIESFFNKLKVELGNLSDYNSAEELITAIKKWIVYYNTKRIQMKLGGTSPINYRLRAA
nr:IS3 family transposase [Lentilactobacillus parabuchneri]